MFTSITIKIIHKYVMLINLFLSALRLIAEWNVRREVKW